MDEEIKKLHRISDTPEERLLESSGDPIGDRIVGILLGFAEDLRERDDWIDLITTRRAREEIKQLLKDHKEGKI